jgi:hypothetical protein
MKGEGKKQGDAESMRHIGDVLPTTFIRTDNIHKAGM